VLNGRAHRKTPPFQPVIGGNAPPRRFSHSGPFLSVGSVRTSRKALPRAPWPTTPGQLRDPPPPGHVPIHVPIPHSEAGAALCNRHREFGMIDWPLLPIRGSPCA